MEYNSHYISKRAFCFTVVLIVITMVNCFIVSSMREDSLKEEILSAVNSAVASKTEANNALILRYLSTMMTSVSPSEPEFLYKVKEYNGKIAVISTDGSVVEILDVYVFMLPDNDKSQLADGIPLYSETELLSIIQDYTS